MTGVLITGRGNADTNMQKEDLVNTPEEDGIYEPRREASEATNLSTSCSWASRLQNCEEIKFCCLSPAVCGTLS